MRCNYVENEKWASGNFWEYHPVLRVSFRVKFAKIPNTHKIHPTCFVRVEYVSPIPFPKSPIKSFSKMEFHYTI